MAKSKLVTINKKIAVQAGSGFRQIKDAVTGNYERIEEWFVEQYLTRDGETVSEARMRLHEENKLRK